MKSILKAFALIILSNGYRINFRLRKINSKRNLTILNLHRVSMDDGSAYKPLNPYIFEQLLKFILKNYTVITFSELYALKSDIIPKKPFLIISFDDGYKDFINIAVPILFKYSVKVNQNIIPDCVDSGNPPLNVLVQDFIGKAHESVLRKLVIPGLALGYRFKNRIKLGQIASQYLKNMPINEQQVIKNEIFKLIGDDLVSFRTPMMNLNDIREINNEHEIGAHSYSHANMEFETDAYLENDLIECKKWFMTNLGNNVEIYAFPNGSYKEKHIQLCKDHGYKHILLVNDKFTGFESEAHNRFGFHAESISEMKFKATCGFCKI